MVSMPRSPLWLLRHFILWSCGVDYPGMNRRALLRTLIYSGAALAAELLSGCAKPERPPGLVVVSQLPKSAAKFDRRNAKLPLIETAFSSKPSSHHDLSGAFTLRGKSLGQLFIDDSGALVATDPVALPACSPFNVKLPKGKHEVVASLFHAGSDWRIAYAKIVIADEPAIAWEAGSVGSSQTTPSGYAVDSGTGSFMSAAASKILAKKFLGGREITEGLKKKRDLPIGWTDLIVDASSGANVIAFESGYGDGIYHTYFGYSGDKRLVAVVTDFLVIDDSAV